MGNIVSQKGENSNRERGSTITWSVQVSHFLKAKLLENRGEPFRIPHASKTCSLGAQPHKIRPKADICVECAPGGIRTPNNGSEDRCDIHFTTGACDHHTPDYAKIKNYTKIRLK